MSCWSHINVQLINNYETKNYDNNLFLEYFRRFFLEIKPFRKMAKTFFLQTMSLIFHRYAAFFLQKDVLQPFYGRACTYNIQNFIAVSTISLCMDRNTGKVSMVWFIFNCIFVFYFYFVLEGYNKNILFEFMFSTFFLDNEIFI